MKAKKSPHEQDEVRRVMEQEFSLMWKKGRTEILMKHMSVSEAIGYLELAKLKLFMRTRPGVKDLLPKLERIDPGK